MTQSTTDLRFVLAIDCFTCLAAGLLMLLGADRLAPLFGLPAPLLGWAGAALLPVAALFGWMSKRRATNRALLAVAVGGNTLWVGGSLVVAIALSPTPVGLVFLLLQAAAVALLALLEARGLTPHASVMA